MIQLIKLKDPSLKRKLILSKFQAENDIIIVSDLKTKVSIESELKQKQDLPSDFCVMRAHDFYKQIFYSMDSDWTLCSDLFIKELMADFCLKHKEKWIRNLHNSENFFKFFNDFFVIFLHKENTRLFSEWFAELKNKFVIWKSWFELGQNFFYFLKSKNLFHESGLKAFLNNHLSLKNESFFKGKRIFVDLDFSFDFCEKDIFKELSSNQEVYILCPDLKNTFFFESLPSVYHNLEEEQGSKSISSSHSFLEEIQPKKEQVPSLFFKVKSRTQIEEIEKAIIQIRHWISLGVPLKDIVVFAPYIEEYWFVFKSYFEREQIPVKKSVFARLFDFPDIQYLLSALRIHLGCLDFKDLEYFSFYKESYKVFSEFYSNYFNVPEKIDLKQLRQDEAHSPDKRITGVQFKEWVLSFWPAKGKSFLKEQLSILLKKFPQEESLKISSWMNVLQYMLFSTELEVEAEDQEGVSLLSFNAFPSSQSSHIFIMGLDEESLKKTSPRFFNELERQKILDDLGFFLPLDQSKELENSLFWFLQSSDLKEVYLSLSNYDFKGDIKTASAVYLLSDFLFSAVEKEIEGSFKWEYKKQIHLKKILDQIPIEKESIKNLSSAFQNNKQPFFHKKPIELSPHSIKTYIECPFKYSAGKLFFIKEKTVLDREMSPLDKGLMAHRLFETVLNQYPNLEISSEQADELIQSLKPNRKNFIYEKQWILLKAYLVNLLNLFLEKERKDRAELGFLKPKVFEKKFTAYWNQKKGEIDSEGDYLFKGQIDRIDKYKEEDVYVIRDYKASGDRFSHISSWLKEGKEEVQLTFYAQILEKGLIEDLPAGKVSALFYSIYKNFSGKGFVDKDSPLESLFGEGLRRSFFKKEREVLSTAIQAGNKKTRDLVELMEKGFFYPKPKKAEICKKCSYKTWCRVETQQKN